MLTIRFNRTGKKNRVSYRVVLQEKTKAPGKRHIEILGSHDPHTKTTILKKDRILEWLAKGVQTSDTVHNLLVREGIVEGKKVARKMPRPEPKEVAEPEVVAEAEEAVADEVKEVVADVVEEVATEAPAVEQATETVAEEVA